MAAVGSPDLPNYAAGAFRASEAMAPFEWAIRGVEEEKQEWLDHGLAQRDARIAQACPDVTIVNVALPKIQVGLAFTAENLQWIVSAYTLVFGGFLLLGGRAADLVGRRAVFIVGFLGRRPAYLHQQLPCLGREPCGKAGMLLDDGEP